MITMVIIAPCLLKYVDGSKNIDRPKQLHVSKDLFKKNMNIGFMCYEILGNYTLISMDYVGTIPGSIEYSWLIRRRIKFKYKYKSLGFLACYTKRMI